MTSIGSLFSGVGGLELGLEMCGLGPVLWQCDSDPAARAVLEAHWPGVRRYSDVREVDGTAEPVALVCGGFPCQPHSVAGKKQGTADARWLWPEFARVIGAVRPTVVFIENVPGLRTSGLRDVLADLAALGFDAEWDLFSAAEVGAPHRRNRLFLLAHAHGPGLEGGHEGEPHKQPAAVRGGAPDLADANGGRRALGGLPQPGGEQGQARGVADRRGDQGDQHRFPPGPDGIGAWDGPEPAVRRVPYGVARWVDRRTSRPTQLRLLGNSCVPHQAALAFRTLSARGGA